MDYRKLLGTALTALTLGSSPAFAQNGTTTGEIRMTWFGVTNWYYEIGDTGVLVDGVVSKFNDKEAPSDRALVERVFKALDRGAGVDKIFIGHEHDDHSFDSVAWAEVTGSEIYTSEVACKSAVERGLAEEQCSPVYGGETIDLDNKTQVHVVRWAHHNKPDRPQRMIPPHPILKIDIAEKLTCPYITAHSIVPESRRNQ